MGRCDLGDFEYEGVSVCEVKPAGIAVDLNQVNIETGNLCSRIRENSDPHSTFYFADATGFYGRDLWERHSFNGEP